MSFIVALPQMHAFAQTTLGDPMNVINEGVKFYLPYHRNLPV